MKRALMAATALAFFIAATALSKSFPITLTEVVNYSDLIAIGTTSGFEETSIRVRSLGAARIAIFHVEKVLVGKGAKEVRILYFPDWEESPRLHVGTRSVAFLARCDGRFEPVQGRIGMVRFAAPAKIISADIEGERPTQSLARFIGRISSRERLGTLKLGFADQWRCWSKN
jgi:hypothetical protein